MTGSPKKPNPTKNVVCFMNIAEVVKRDMITAGTRSAANFLRGLSSGNGGVGERAL